MLVFGAGVAAWVAARILVLRTPDALGPHAAIGVERGGVLIAGAVFHNYRRHDIEVSFASDDPRWARRATIRAILRYPFVQLGCTRLTALIARDNARAARLLQGLGFKREGVLRRAYDGTADALVYGMLREECHWLEDIHGKEHTKRTAAA